MKIDVKSNEFQTAFLAASVELMKRHPRSICDMDTSTAITLVGQLQLALRHPGNRGESAAVTDHFVRAMIETLSKDDASGILRTGLMAGFDPNCDMTRQA